jgi:hypothetical protein
MKPSWPTRALIAITEALDRTIGWDKLPKPLGILTLAGIREKLRAENLYDTGRGALDKPPFVDPDPPFAYLTSRTIDGTYNDLHSPLMGGLGSRFGRNVPLDKAYPDSPERLLEPNPRLVSRRVMTRDEFRPASSLNLLAAAWIQFEVHDWINHGTVLDDPWLLPLEAEDPWPERPMRIDRTQRDPSTEPNAPPTFLNTDTHWWDGSQIYGDDPAFSQLLRSGTGGTLKVDRNGFYLPEVDQHLDLSGVAGNFWIGLGLLHSLFMLEHNAICAMLASRFPSWSDDEFYRTARLINVALMAKIHTVDWTPAIIAHPTTVLALRSNWWGLLGERFDKRYGRRTKLDFLRGVPGSPTNHNGVPYSLTEEFVAVYRMHPLMPDQFIFRSLTTDAVLQTRSLSEVGALEVRNRFNEMSMKDIFYSFGRSNPGAVTLHNYPKSLQHFNRPDGTLIDLAAIDILRSRERGVPRYNEFRRLFHLRPMRTFDELTGNPAWAGELSKLYNGDIERVDLTVGMYAERLPRGFGFSDTAFRVFILMATRRLKSDRFFTEDYTSEVYTQPGIDWVESNSMSTVLLRHYPELEPALRGVGNPFAPWNQVGHVRSS